MTDQRKQEITELINIVNELDPLSLMLLTTGANMLKAKEQMEKRNQSFENDDTLKAG